MNAVAPGPVDTPMLNRFVGGSEEHKQGFLPLVPLKRAAQPDEIAQTIVFLGSVEGVVHHGQDAQRRRRCVLRHLSSRRASFRTAISTFLPGRQLGQASCYAPGRESSHHWQWRLEQ